MWEAHSLRTLTQKPGPDRRVSLPRLPDPVRMSTDPWGGRGGGAALIHHLHQARLVSYYRGLLTLTRLPSSPAGSLMEPEVASLSIQAPLDLPWHCQWAAPLCREPAP